jgi:hypothetical protein
MKRKIVFALGVVVYIASLFFPAWQCATKQLIGGDVLAIGWMGIKIGEPRWFCNLVIILAWLALGKPKKAQAMTCFALALLASTTLLGPYYCGPRDGAFYQDGSALGLGGYLWCVALWLFALSTLAPGIFSRVNSDT